LVAKYTGKVHVVQLDVSNKASTEAAAAEVKAKAGRLDVVISNAGRCSLVLEIPVPYSLLLIASSRDKRMVWPCA
jgi:NAD(P)-dependent dehydrogenase (short-subunit alcohol dehydrogenase family)